MIGFNATEQQRRDAASVPASERDKTQRDLVQTGQTSTAVRNAAFQAALKKAAGK